VRSRRWLQGARLGQKDGATLEDVAALAKVSRATAARALNGYGYVGEDTAKRVRAAAKRFGYQTNRVAQALRSGQLPIIGFVPGDIQNPFFARIAHDVDVALRRHSYNVLIASSEENTTQERQVLAGLRALNPQGLILAPASTKDCGHIRELVRDGMPVVLIDRLVRNVACDSVTVDNEAGAWAAIEYLVDMGHRRIGFLGDETPIFTTEERLGGYRKALSAHGIPYQKRLVVTARSTVQDAIEATEKLFRRAPRPTALLTVDSIMTQGALLGLRSLGIAIPEDVSLIGFDDFDLATFTAPPITVVAQPTAEIGRLAAQLLLERLGQRDIKPRSVRFPTKLVRRGSVRQLAV
jgi:LacI family transcriptional regulator